MKKFVCLILLGMLCLSGCQFAGKRTENLEILCTNFPLYDWTRELVGDVPGVTVSLLVGNGTDLHSYQPTVADIVHIANCDLFLYIGGESDQWVADPCGKAGEDRPLPHGYAGGEAAPGRRNRGYP